MTKRNVGSGLTMHTQTHSARSTWSNTVRFRSHIRRSTFVAFIGKETQIFFSVYVIFFAVHHMTFLAACFIDELFNFSKKFI
jgi:hypothetical protein